MKYFACGILFLLSALALAAQSKLAYKDVFDRNAGLNHATSCMVEDREGFFWIGTHNGLYRFDGSQAREIRFWPDDSTAVHSRMVFSLVLDRTNDFLWIGSGNGVFKYHLHSGKSEKIAAEWFFPKGDFKFPQCRLIYQDRQGELWAHFAVSGLVHLKDGGKSAERFTVDMSEKEDSESAGWAHANCVSGIAQDALQDSLIWVGTKAGLIKFNKNNCTIHRYYFSHPSKDMRKSANAMEALFPWTDGKIYIGTYNGGLLVFDPVSEQFKQYLLHPEAVVGKSRENKVESILYHSPNELWVSGESELFLLNTQTGNFRRILQSSGVDFIDRTGNYWDMVANGLKLFHHSKNQIPQLLYPDEAPYKGAVTFRIREDTVAQTIFVRTAGIPGMPAYDRRRQQWNMLTFPTGSNTPVRGHVLEKTEKGILVNDMERFYILPPGQSRFRPLLLGTAENPSFLFSLPGPKGDVFISGNRGYFFWLKPDADKVQSYYRTDIGEPVRNHFNILTISTVDDKGRPWFTCDGGFSLFLPDENRFIHVPISLHPERHFSQYRAFCQDRTGRMWCLGFNEIGWLDPDCPEEGLKQRFYHANDFPLADMASSLHADKSGRLWFLSKTDLIRLDPEKLEFTIFESIGASDFTLLPGGELAFPRPYGIGIVHPDSLRQTTEQPKPYIAWFKVFDKETPLAGSSLSPPDIRLGFKENFFSIGFSALGFFNPQKYRYAYQLEGVDKDWVHPEPGNQVAGYTDLKGGNYVFRLKVANSLGEWSETPLEWAIHVGTPWWETPLFRILLLAFIIGAVYIFFRIRMQQQRILLENQRLHYEKEISLRNERDRIASEMHDDLGAGLSTIRFLSLLAKEKETDQTKAGRIDKIARSAAEVMEKMADIIWVMNSRNDSLENFANYFRRYAGDYLDTHGIRFVFHMPETLPPLMLSGEQRRTLLLALKECMHNAVKHAGATEFHMQLSLNGHLVIAAEDNGKGLPLKHDHNGTNGNGLQNIRRRMESLGGTAILENGKGLKVILKTGIPVP